MENPVMLYFLHKTRLWKPFFGVTGAIHTFCLNRRVRRAGLI